MDTDRLRASIAAAQAGRAEGFQAILDAYGRRLYSYFLRATGRHHDAEDLLSEITLRLVRRLGSYDHKGRFDQWIFRIAANMVRDRIRRIKVRPRNTSLSVEDDSGQALADRLPGESRSVDSGLLHGESSAGLQAALEQLDDKTRQMIVLRHFSDMSFKQIAEVFDCPLGTALARVHRGMKALRKLMDSDHELE